jgi:hypothetical protein
MIQVGELSMESDSAERSIISRYQRTIAGVLIAIILVDVGIMIYHRANRAQYTLERQQMNFVFRFDPNTAKAEELEVVPGLNRKLAQAIIDYRLEYRRHYPQRPAFMQAADLTAVKGISEKTMNKVQEFLVFPGQEKTNKKSNDIGVSNDLDG